MSVIKSKLKITKNGGFVVTLPTKKGEAPFNISRTAQRFRAEDAVDGIEVEVTRAANGQPEKVIIPGKAVVSGSAASSPSSASRRPYQVQGRGHGGYQQRGYGGNRPPDTANAPVSRLGLPFHNPYTFMSFPATAQRREKPVLLTQDELDKERFTGVIELQVTPLSPLITLQAHREKGNGHQRFEALTIGDDVIVPATGVRGALRYLTTIVTGSSLSAIDDEMYLCQQRDLPMALNPTAQQKACCLARVSKAGDHRRGGIVQLGETRMVHLARLIRLSRDIGGRRPTKAGNEVWIDDPDNPGKWSIERRDDCTWQVKLSGKPINVKPKKVYVDNADSPTRWSGQSGTVCTVQLDVDGRSTTARIRDKVVSLPQDFWEAWEVGFKKEGAFRVDATSKVELPSEMWRAYQNRNRFGDRQELKAGDLVWLELKCPGNPPEADDIVSLQWARWGREGTKLTEKVPANILPDYRQNDGKASIATNLFGQVPVSEKDSQLPAFAGRVRPDNLVFENGRKHLTGVVPLAVLSSPHPGCLPFYRSAMPDELNKRSPLKGYKVYRTSKHAGVEDPEAPWKYESQGVYNDHGKLKNGGNESVNFSAQLLKPEISGTVRLSVRSMSWEEMSLLRMLCNDASWRLGGGKPLGLGHCKVEIRKIHDEDGNEVAIDDARFLEVSSTYKQRFEMWEQMQMPVELLRYPRAANRNRNKITRGGLSWFQKLGTPKKDQHGMQVFRYGDNVIDGQMLPEFSPTGDDALFGYDVFLDDDRRQGHSYPGNIEQFDPVKHVRGDERSRGFHGQNHDTRSRGRRDRGG